MCSHARTGHVRARARAHTLGVALLKPTCSRASPRAPPADRLVRRRKQRLLPPKCRGAALMTASPHRAAEWININSSLPDCSVISETPQRSPVIPGPSSRTVNWCHSSSESHPRGCLDLFSNNLLQTLWEARVMVPVPLRLLAAPWQLSPWPPFVSLSSCFRCLSAGSRASLRKLSAVFLFNYVHFCCLLLHAVSGPLRVSDLLCNMACEYRGLFSIHPVLSCVWSPAECGAVWTRVCQFETFIHIGFIFRFVHPFEASIYYNMTGAHLYHSAHLPHFVRILSSYFLVILVTFYN